MIEPCINYMTELYQDSNIPVVQFSADMEVIWSNQSFSQYFPGRELKGSNMSALTRTQLKMHLATAKGHSGRFQIKLHSNTHVSSSVVLLVFPADNKKNRPENFVGFIDDLTQDQNMMLRKTYLGLLEASKLKDDDTGNHIKRVGAYARKLSEECYQRKLFSQINLDFIENIHFLAPMHDVGKIGTPDEILNKRGPLDESQWSIMKEHTINGALILSNYPDKMASEIARAHHEKWDGSGYLFGLTGDDIPLAARITAIADVYDALRMKRSYKDAFPHSKAVEIIKKDRATHFDPVLVDVFESIADSFDSIYEALSDESRIIEPLEIEELELVDEDFEEITELEEL
ncbi:MAG: HD domain-containing protein [Spirochaetales bacterium]|uniref:HD domain-containing protein n=1 Tax=Candidatus Thalassospirochaeta sargassi TaxID=3119039 RepID=A0AAJ1IET9_9SPIO|nr:HD domain-containing protein [Spirochaetales bacterium]